MDRDCCSCCCCCSFSTTLIGGAFLAALMAGILIRRSGLDPLPAVLCLAEKRRYADSGEKIGGKTSPGSSTHTNSIVSWQA